jgi:hypothetical protein
MMLFPFRLRSHYLRSKPLSGSGFWRQSNLTDIPSAPLSSYPSCFKIGAVQGVEADEKRPFARLYEMKQSSFYLAIDLPGASTRKRSRLIDRDHADFISACRAQAVETFAAAHHKKPLGLDRDSHSPGVCHFYCPPYRLAIE